MKKRFIKTAYLDRLSYMKGSGGRVDKIQLKPKQKRYYNSLAYYKKCAPMFDFELWHWLVL